MSLSDATEAVRILAAQGVAVTGWETWYLYPDGRMGHAGTHHSGYQGRLVTESWSEFVRRSAKNCIDTAHQCDAYLSPRSQGEKVYFCLSIETEG